MSSTDWTTFNNKQNALTNPVTGTGTTNYHPKFSSSSAITTSGIYEGVANYISIGNTNTTYNLDVTGTGRFTGALSGTSATFSGLITYSGTSQILNAASGTTGYLYQYLANTTGAAYFGLERSTGGGLFTGSSAYATVLGSATLTDLQLGTNGIVRVTLAASTGAATFSSSVTATSFSNAGLQSGEVFNATKSNAGYFVGYLQNTSATGYGLYIQNGTNSLASIRISNAAGTANTIELFGSGAATFSSSVQIGTAVTNYGTLQTFSGYTSPSLTVGTAAAAIFSCSAGQELALTMNGTAPYGINFQARNNTGGGPSGTSYPIIFNPLGGNVGIGTSSPTRLLDVNGVIRTQNAGSAGAPSIELGTSPQGNGLYYPTTNTIAIVTNDTERMRITSGGLILFKGSSTTTNAEAVIENTNSLLSFEASASGSVAKDIRFVTSAGATNLERMRITSGGQVGINITPGSDRMLQVKGSDATSSNFAFTAQNTAAYLFEIRNDGVIFTGTLSGSPYNNSVTGRDAYLSSSGVLGYLSSTRESKTNINSVSDINWVSQLKPVSFNYRKKDDEMNYTEEFFDDKSFGFIADEVEKVNPDFVFYDINEDGTKKLAGVKYQSMTAILTKIVQELSAQNQDLKSRLDKAGL